MLQQPTAALRAADPHVPAQPCFLAFGAERAAHHREDRLYPVPARDENVLIHDRSRNIPEILGRSIRYARCRRNP
jgi:hypothetical protein